MRRQSCAINHTRVGWMFCFIVCGMNIKILFANKLTITVLRDKNKLGQFIIKFCRKYGENRKPDNGYLDDKNG
ncbi:MAG: hypothetical protein ACTIM4_12885 [Marinomonas sp.]